MGIMALKISFWDVKVFANIFPKILIIQVSDRFDKALWEHAVQLMRAVAG
jgi:hypothetical protein